MNYFSVNRLIIVTQEDIDEGNIPGINDFHDKFHDGENLWLMNEVMDGPDFNLLSVYLIPAIDGGATIDYLCDYSPLENLIGMACMMYDDEDVEDVVMSDIMNRFEDYDIDEAEVFSLVQEAIKETEEDEGLIALAEYLVSLEIPEVNIFLDLMVKERGYIECHQN